ncbi:MAG: radical SAM protein [Candidatus Brocadiaceae bacterium]|nr:radical SAM protein [Candidatus Brocadiaceae bacterium]
MRLPEDLIVFITSQCQLRCKHCFYWKSLEEKRSLPLLEVESLSKSLPKLRRLSLSGGEPFLRRDLVELCRYFLENCQLDLLEIPTSGTVESIPMTVEKIAAIRPYVQLSISISLDGLAEYHDMNRGKQGTFSKAVECCRALLKLKEKIKNLKVNIITTVTKDNTDELLSLLSFIERELPFIDNLFWGVLRGNLKDEAPDVPSVHELEQIDKQFMAFKVTGKDASAHAFERAFYGKRLEALKENRQPVPCVAGNSIAVVYEDGAVAPCELLPPVGKIREKSFDTIWNGEEMTAVRKRIRANSCACAHGCFLGPSYREYLQKKPLALFRVLGIRGVINRVIEVSNLGCFAKAVRMVFSR